MTNGTTLNSKITRINTLNTTEVALKNNELDTQRANFEEKERHMLNWKLKLLRKKLQKQIKSKNTC